MMRRFDHGLLTVTLAMVTLLVPTAWAQEPGLGLPSGGPIAVAGVFHYYRDSRGDAALYIHDAGVTLTGARLIKVTLHRRSVRFGDVYYYGSGTRRWIEGTRSLVNFFVTGPGNTNYVYEGNLSDGVALFGAGTYHRAADLQTTTWWRIWR